MTKYRILSVRTSVLLAFFVLVLGATSLRAATDTDRPMVVETWGSYLMGDKDSKQDAKLLALYDAKRQALEKAGTELSSTTKVLNNELVSDEVLSLAAGRIQAEILEEKWEPVGESLRVRLKVRSTIRPSDLQQAKAVSPAPTPTAAPADARLWDAPAAPQPTPQPQVQTESEPEPVRPTGSFILKPTPNRGLGPALRQTPQPTPQPAPQPVETPGDALARGYAMVSEGRLPQALDLSDQILARYPRFAEVYLLRARIYKEQGDTRQAVVELQSGCQLGSERACQLWTRALQNQYGGGRQEWNEYNNRRQPGFFSRRP